MKTVDQSLESSRLNLRLITVHYHVEDFLACYDAVSRVIDISIRTDHRAILPAHADSLAGVVGLRQNARCELRSLDQYGIDQVRSDC